ncbi:HIT domain-containing protein [Candidatus Woesearchaeota archaeon]|nr:HIT domain-containing protein [Candidatus Woesearchaeota archaeon]
MTIIYETEKFILESHERPEIDRLEGGHVKISPKVDIEDRSKLTPKQAIELMRFTIISGEAMKLAMKQIGVNIGRINYQDNGNWTPHLHIHLYCRAENATMQKYGDPITPGHKDEYKPLNEEDIKRIKKELENLFKLEKFSDSMWGLS